MARFESSRSQPADEIQVRNIEFLGAQDGPFEQQLKERLVEFFIRDKSVYKAYLVRLQSEHGQSVSLCLRTQYGVDKGLIEKIAAIFKTIFNAQSKLDIIFITLDQEKKVGMVCNPFFSRAVTTINRRPV